MTRFLLDTNVPSEIVRLRADHNVDLWVRQQDDEALYLSVVTIGEIRKGLAMQPEGKRRLPLQRWLEEDIIPMFSDRILPVTQAVAETWGGMSGLRQRMGRPLSMADGLIAATARESGLTLVTRNVRDFDDLGITILNPWDEANQTVILS